MADPVYGTIIFLLVGATITILIQIHSFGNDYLKGSARADLWEKKNGHAKNIYEIEQRDKPGFLIRSYYVYAPETDRWFAHGILLLVFLVLACIGVGASRELVQTSLANGREMFWLMQVTALSSLALWLGVCAMKFRAEKNRLCILEIHTDTKIQKNA